MNVTEEQEIILKEEVRPIHSRYPWTSAQEEQSGWIDGTLAESQTKHLRNTRLYRYSHANLRGLIRLKTRNIECKAGVVCDVTTCISTFRRKLFGSHLPHYTALHTKKNPNTKECYCFTVITWWSSNALELYPGDPHFEPRQRHRLSLLRYSVVFFSLSRQLPAGHFD
jgi:hypothetical protein